MGMGVAFKGKGYSYEFGRGVVRKGPLHCSSRHADTLMGGIKRKSKVFFYSHGMLFVMDLGVMKWNWMNWMG